MPDQEAGAKCESRMFSEALAQLRGDEKTPECETGRRVLQSEDARLLGQLINERLHVIVARRCQTETERATLPSIFLPPLH